MIASAGPVDLRAMGGARPLSFLIDGAPIPSLARLRDTEWTPPEPGIYRVTVLDASGAAGAAPPADAAAGTAQDAGGGNPDR
jgi:penicillin-binding protein 1C